MPAWRSASMLLIARLTTEVSSCANSTPSDVATRTSPAFVSLAAAFGSMVTLIISFLRVAPGASRSKVPHVAARPVRFRFREGKRMFVVRNIINSDRAVLRLHRSLLAMWVRHRCSPTRFLHSTRCSAATRVVKRLTGKVKAWFLLPLAVEEITRELSGFQGGLNAYCFDRGRSVDRRHRPLFLDELGPRRLPGGGGAGGGPRGRGAG